MKIKDKSVKLYLIKRLEDYNSNMDFGNLEYGRVELEKNKFYLFVILTLIGLFFTFIKNEDFLFVFLLFLLVFEIIYISFSNKHIHIANGVIIHYQKRRVPERYINKLLEEIEETWDLDWGRLTPIVTESMIKEEKFRVK